MIKRFYANVKCNAIYICTQKRSERIKSRDLLNNAPVPLLLIQLSWNLVSKYGLLETLVVEEGVPSWWKFGVLGESDIFRTTWYYIILFYFPLSTRFSKNTHSITFQVTQFDSLCLLYVELRKIECFLCFQEFTSHNGAGGNQAVEDKDTEAFSKLK